MSPDRLGNSAVYGESAARILEQIRKPVVEHAERFVKHFYESLHAEPRIDAVFGRLSAEEISRLHARQAQHLKMLLSPELTEAAHTIHAEHAGAAHALVGVEVLWLVETYTVYLRGIEEILESLALEAAECERLTYVVNQRILLDMRGQVSGHGRIDAATDQVMMEIDKHVFTAANLADLVRGSIAIVGTLPGEVSVFFARADSRGELQIEASHGATMKDYQRAMEAGRIPKISIDPMLDAGQGPSGCAWRSGEIQFSDTWQRDPRMRAWKLVGDGLGFRSSASVPLLDASGNSFALLSMYSKWPGYFSTRGVRGFMTHLQRTLGYAIERLNRAEVIPQNEQQRYRKLLEKQRVSMLYQPIIDLRSGRLVRVEALARLRGENGELITPDRFLPTFGQTELIKLFEYGLKAIFDDSREFDEAGLRIQFAINCPAQGLGDVRYEQALFSWLESSGFDPSRLQLEILETEDGHGPKDEKHAFFERLKKRGISIAQDDLGSGHSSLLRMDEYGFDEVKIDQGLVRSSLRKPHRALEFILYLTRLAHAFHTRVVVEGLENQGILEAAAILGADLGQGYGILRPKFPREVIEWQRDFRFPVDRTNPKTALGAMASYLLGEIQVEETPDAYLAARGMAPRGRLDRYLTANDLQGSPLGDLLREAVRPGAVNHAAKEATDRIDGQVIDYLTEYWLAELAR